MFEIKLPLYHIASSVTSTSAVAELSLHTMAVVIPPEHWIRSVATSTDKLHLYVNLYTWSRV